MILIRVKISDVDFDSHTCVHRIEDGYSPMKAIVVLVLWLLLQSMRLTLTYEISYMVTGRNSNSWLGILCLISWLKHSDRRVLGVILQLVLIINMIFTLWFITETLYIPLERYTTKTRFYLFTVINRNTGLSNLLNREVNFLSTWFL